MFISHSLNIKDFVHLISNVAREIYGPVDAISRLIHFKLLRFGRRPAQNRIEPNKMIDTLEQAGATPNAVKQVKEALRGILDVSASNSPRAGGNRITDTDNYDWHLFSDDSSTSLPQKDNAGSNVLAGSISENSPSSVKGLAPSQNTSSPSSSTIALDADALLQQTGVSSWVDRYRGPDRRLGLPSFLALLAELGIAPSRLSLPLARACFRSAAASASAAATAVQGSVALAGPGHHEITAGSTADPTTDSLDSDGIVRCFGLLIPLAFPNTPGHSPPAAEDRTAGALEALARHLRVGELAPVSAAPLQQEPRRDTPYERLFSVGPAGDSSQNGGADPNPGRDTFQPPAAASPPRAQQGSSRSLFGTPATAAIDAAEREAERESGAARERALAQQYQAELDALASDFAAREAELQIRCQQVRAPRTGGMGRRRWRRRTERGREGEGDHAPSPRFGTSRRLFPSPVPPVIPRPLSARAGVLRVARSGGRSCRRSTS